jgi:hypothetical protein
MPESKRWIDPAIIQRNWEEGEAARDAEERRRKANVVERNKRMVSALKKQQAERASLKAQSQRDDERYSKAFLATADAETAKDVEEKRLKLQMRLKTKLELEAQMRENARRRVVAQMSETEKLVNKPLLSAVSEFEASKSLSLKPYPAEFLPKDLRVTQDKLNSLHSKMKIQSARHLISRN